MSNQTRALVERWTTDEGRRKVKEIVKLLQKGKEHTIIEVVGAIDGRCDLRGFPFPAPEKTGRTAVVGDYQFELISHAAEFAKLSMNHFDFSGANLANTTWRKSSLTDCVFNNSNLRDAAFFACSISDSRLSDCDLTGCVLGGHIGNDSGALINTTFTEGKFREVVFAFPRIEGCSFDCDMTNVDFDGSQLVDCRFSGKLDRVIFRKRYRPSSSDAGIDPNRIPINEMKKVDFSRAIFEDVDFRGGVELTGCIFPRIGDVLLLKNASRLFERARGIIASEWLGEERRIALGYIEQYFSDLRRDGQAHFVVNGEMLRKVWGARIGERFISLLRRITENEGVT